MTEGFKHFIKHHHSILKAIFLTMTKQIAEKVSNRNKYLMAFT